MGLWWYNWKQIGNRKEEGWGMAKVICESCGTSYKYEVAKGMITCPVCGENLWDNEEIEVPENSSGQKESEDGLMYFDQIMIFEKEPEYSGVMTYCSECGQIDSLDLDLFDKLVDKEYVILKESITVTCRGCGKEHKPRKIFYKRKDSYAPSRPRCPVCNSAMLKKIKTSSKVLAAATVGVFALPYNSKTFECKDCGYRF